MKDGYSPIPQDLKMFGLDHGHQFWWRRMEKFDDEIAHLQQVKTKLNRRIRALHDVPPDLDPRQLALEAGAEEERCRAATAPGGRRRLRWVQGE